MNNREFFNSMAEKWDSTVNHDVEKIGRILNIVGLEVGDNDMYVVIGIKVQDDDII